MITDLLLRPVTAVDLVEISALHARVFGPGRFARTAYRVREATRFASPFCRAIVGADDRIIAAIRYTEIAIGGRAGVLLLGPLAVEPAHANQGHGRRLMDAGTEAARGAGLELIVLVGDAPYYGRLGFAPIPHGQVMLPGPVDPARLLALELVDGATAKFRGMVVAAQAARGDQVLRCGRASREPQAT